MKRFTTSVFYATILLLIFASCQKEITSENALPLGNNQVGSDSNFLSRLVLSYEDASGSYIAHSIDYQYDNLKRVSQVLDSSDENSSDIFLSYSLTEYFYQGNDTLPFKSMTIYYPGTIYDYDSTVTFYTYNNMGLLVADSFAGSKSRQTTNPFQTKIIGNYTYNGSTLTAIYESTHTNQYGTTTGIETDTAYRDANGNIVQSVRHWGGQTTHSTITWDDKPSPIAKLNIYQTLNKFPFGETFFYELPQINNRLHILEITTSTGFPFTYEEDLTGNYTYNANGYPVQILEPDASTPGAYEKTIFEYKSL